MGLDDILPDGYTRGTSPDEQPDDRIECQECGRYSWTPAGVGAVISPDDSIHLTPDASLHDGATVDVYYCCDVCGSVMVTDVPFDLIQDERDRIN